MPRADALCGRCQRRPPTFDRIRAPWLYASPLDTCIQELKFHGGLAAGRLLGQLLARQLQRVDIAVDHIVPMPLHRSRLRGRGFNQSMELAGPVARALDVELSPGMLLRHRQTAAQAELPLAARHGNVRDAFRAGEVVGLRIAVVDDVVTSGGTAEAAARTLKDAGASVVEVWAVCRTPAPQQRIKPACGSVS